jgi:hypothetical protein
MSKKDIRYVINIDAKDANKSVGKLRQEAKATVGEVKDLSGATATLSNNLNKGLNSTIKETEQRTNSLKSELRRMKEELLTLDEGSKEFQELSFNAAQLQDAIGDVNSRVKILSSDTLRLDQTLGVIKGMAGAYSVVQGTMALVGVENEALMKTMVKLQAIQATVNGITEVSNMLNKDSAAGILLRDLRTKALNTSLFTQTGATTATTVATRALGAAMTALPILAIVAGITAIVVAMNNTSKETERAYESLKKLNQTNLDNLKLQIFQLSNANDAFTQSLNDIQLQVLDNVLSEAEADKKRKELYSERLRQINEEKEQARIALGGRIFAIEQQLGVETKVNETFDDKIVRLKELIYLQGEDNKALKGIQLQLELYTNTLKTESDLKQNLSSLNDKGNKQIREEINNRRELLFLIEQQLKINELDQLKFELQQRQKNGEDILDLTQTIANKEIDIVNHKYSYAIKAASGNKDQIELLELQKVNELNKINNQYLNDASKASEDVVRMQTKSVKEQIKSLQTEINKEPITIPVEISGPDLDKFIDTMSQITQYANMAGSIISDGFNVAFNQLQTDMNNAAIMRDEYMRAETLNLQTQLGEQLISKEEYDSKLQQLNDAMAVKETNERRKAFSREKSMRVGQATMAMLQGMLQAFTGALSLGFPAGPIVGAIMSATVGAMGAANISAIKQEQFRAASGGIVPGQPSKRDSVNSLLAPGEMVINSTSASMFGPQLSAINELGGGRKLISNSQIEPEQKLVNNKSQEMRAYVVYNDIKQTSDQYNDLYNSSRW